MSGRKYLVPIDNSEISKELVRIASRWATHTKAELFFLHVGSKDLADRDKLDHQFSELLGKMEITAEYQFSHRIGTPYLEILAMETEIQPDLIIMGAHSHTMLGRLFLGGCTKYVLHHGTCPVYVYKQQNMFFENKIVVPIDYNEINKPVIEIADRWALRTEAELNFIRVDTYPEATFLQAEIGYNLASRQFSEQVEHEQGKVQQEVKDQEAALEDFISAFKLKSKYKCVHKFGAAYQKILEFQNYIDARLIMMASHSHTFLDRLFTGSNTDYLMHHANCPMYIYKEPGN